MASITSLVHRPMLRTRRLFSASLFSSNRVPRSNHVLCKPPPSLAAQLDFSLSPEKGNSSTVYCFSKPLRLFPAGRNLQVRRRGSSGLPVVKAAEAKGDAHPAKGFDERFPALVTGFFFFMWYFLNVIFNILNKKLCICHTSASWSGVLSSLLGCWSAKTCTLEPFFNASASQFVLGHRIPLSLWLSLAPVVIGVSVASLTELSFNWTGFVSAMISNIAFTYRSIYSKKAMTGMDSTNVYAYISIIALLFCIPPAILIEGPQLMQYGFRDAIAKVGLLRFVSDLFWIGMFYHLYNQVATNTLERVAPLTHAVGNVLKRVFVIGFSIVVFGNKISIQTGIGTAIAIAGVAIYSLIKANIEEQKQNAALPSAS